MHCINNTFTEDFDNRNKTTRKETFDNIGTSLKIAEEIQKGHISFENKSDPNIVRRH